MERRIKIGISSCLLGKNVRYDGGHKLDHYLVDTLGSHVEWVPVCPEVEYGLPVPREAMRLVGDPASPRLVTRSSGVDHTRGMQAWAKGKLKDLETSGLCGFIFKSRSPSSGYRGVKVYSGSGIPSRKGTGIFAAAFIRRFPLVPIEDDGRLHDPRLRENFIERVFVFQRWKGFLESGPSVKGLVEFHTRHKLLLMAHSQKHYSLLGRLVAQGGNLKKDDTLSLYIGQLMEGLKLIATVKKNTNVLSHTAGYLKKRLVPDERAELVQLIENYHRGLVPLIVPITLIQHYARKFDEPYLKKQHYLSPHPLELMLRNHV
jgi:uncharacterized protein YbgA (DUF1722 family)/uncharacterized protein YbbK (DUF523 family)